MMILFMHVTNMKENTRFLRDMITIALLSSQIHDICDAPMV